MRWDRALTEAIVTMRQVSVVRQGRALLADLNWHTLRGQHWALLGANGAGKSTLLQILLGYLWPTTGRIDVLGHTLGAVDVRELRKWIGFVSVHMDARLEPAESALRVVLTGLHASYELYDEPTEDEVAQARERLAELDIAFLEARPYHLLSQGERQKVMIARALMAKPRLLILDEPCNGLDFPSRERLLISLEAIARRADAPQLLYVTHYPDELIPAISHTLLLREGCIVASGPKERVIVPETLSAAFGTAVTVAWQEGYPVVRAIRSTYI